MLNHKIYLSLLAVLSINVALSQDITGNAATANRLKSNLGPNLIGLGWDENTGKIKFIVDATTFPVAPLDISGNAQTATNWGNRPADFDATPLSTGVNFMTGFGGTSMVKAISATGVREFIGMPAGGETLQSITDRGNNTTNGLTIGNVIAVKATASDNIGVGPRTYYYNDGTGSGNYAAATQLGGGGDLDFWVYHPTSDGWSIPRMRITKDGNVGIGTKTPVERLQVIGNISLDRNRYIFFGGNSSTTGEYIYENPGGTLKIHAGGQDAIVIPNNDNVYLTPNAGNVGIGTTAPQSKLAVKGTITAQKVVITQTGWADYVFDSAYQLTSLPQVEKYIQENKHLPGVPSAATVEKEGVSVGDSQVLLLKKIEELTLYIIKQNKQLAAQGKKLEAQEQKIQQLEQKIK